MRTFTEIKIVIISSQFKL